MNNDLKSKELLDKIRADTLKGCRPVSGQSFVV